MMDNLDISRMTGLSEQEAAERLRAEGYNELLSARQHSTLAIATDVMREPMFLFLVVGSAIYFVLGDTEEALMLLFFVLVVIGITLYQERKTEHALAALRDLSSPRALVVRDGKENRIAGREVVRGDIVILIEGDRVPADGVVLFCLNLSADESLLTGESVPVGKSTWNGMLEMGRPGGDDLPFVFSGTMVVQGRGVAEVCRTGSNTELGRIGEALRRLEPEDTAVQKETRSWVGVLARVGLALCALVVVTYGLTVGNWPQALLAGITLAMATIPEEFPVVLTVFSPSALGEYHNGGYLRVVYRQLRLWVPLPYFAWTKQVPLLLTGCRCRRYLPGASFTRWTSL